MKRVGAQRPIKRDQRSAWANNKAFLRATSVIPLKDELSTRLVPKNHNRIEEGIDAEPNQKNTLDKIFIDRVYVNELIKVNNLSLFKVIDL